MARLKITKIMRESIAERDNYSCQLRENGCEGSATQQHHIVFKSLGGNDTAYNLICLCNSCHRLAHDKGKKYYKVLFNIQQKHYSNLTKQMMRLK